MGLAWLAAAVAVAWTAFRAQTRGRTAASWALVPAALFLLLALATTPAEDPRLLVRFEGLAAQLGTPGEPQPVLTLASVAPDDEKRADETAATLEIRALPATGTLRVVATRPAKSEGSADVRVRAVPAGPPALVGFSASRRELTNVHVLDGDEVLVVCPDSDGCTRRELRVSRDEAGNFAIGGCSLEEEQAIVRRRRGVWRFLGRDRDRENIRTLALLDAYGHDEKCVPRKVVPGRELWPRRGIEPALRSFLFIADDEVLLAYLDGPSLLKVEGLDESKPRLDAAASGTVLRIVEPRLRPRFDAFEREEVDPDSPACAGGYGTPKLCKRAPVYYGETHLRFDTTPERLLVLLASRPTVAVRSPCDGEDGEAWGLESIPLLYTAGPAPATSAADRRLDFEHAVWQREPLLTRFLISRDHALCGTAGVPCITNESPAGRYALPLDRVLPLGNDGVQHLLRFTLVGLPWWLAAAFLGAALLVLAAIGELGGLARVLLAGMFVLLAARLLFAFKATVGFPHDSEGVGNTLIGAAALPILVALGAEGFPGWRRFASWMGAAAVGLALLAGLQLSGVLVVFQPESRLVAVVLGAAIAFVLAEQRWGARLRFDDVASARRVRVVMLVLLGSAGAVRLGLAIFGVERAFGVPIVFLYWPLVTVLAGLAIRATLAEVAKEPTQDGATAPATPIRTLASRWALLLLLALFAIATQGLARGDKGAALVLGPAAALGLVFVVRRSGAHRLLTRLVSAGFVGAVVLAIAASVGLAVLVERTYAPVTGSTTEWAARDGSTQICPVVDSRANDPLALAPYEESFLKDNVSVRLDDWFVPGAASRSGTRIGAEVHQFMSVLRRYAAGPTGSAAGAGYLCADLRRYGRAEVDAQLNDGVASVLLASEGGTIAVVALLLLHLALLLAVLRRNESTDATDGAAPARAFVAVTLAAVPAWTTLLMLAGNFGLFPLTGQSTPLLVVLSGADLVLAPLLWATALHASREAAPTEVADAR